MTAVVVGDRGEIELPLGVRESCGLNPETRVRLVKTSAGLLLVPLTDEPMSAALQDELCPKVGDGVIRRRFEVA